MVPVARDAGCAEIDRAGVVRDGRRRQRPGNGLALAEVAGRGRAGIGDRGQANGAHRFGRAGDELLASCAATLASRNVMSSPATRDSVLSILPPNLDMRRLRVEEWPDYTRRRRDEAYRPLTTPSAAHAYTTVRLANSTVSTKYPAFNHHAVRCAFTSNTPWSATRTPQNTAM